MRDALLAATLGLIMTGCTTSAQTSTAAVYEAIFVETPDNQTRDMIHNHVRDIIGPDYIVTVDDLMKSPVLLAVDRGRGQVSGQRIPVPDRQFRLELTDTNDGQICRLTLVDDGSDLPALILSETVVCTAATP